MSVPFHHLQYRAFVHSTEDPAKVLQALRNVVGDVDPETDRASGFHGNPMTIYQGEISSDRRIDAFFRRLADDGLTPHLLAEADARLDEEIVWHLRLDKDAAFDGEMAVAGPSDVVAVWGKVESYPAKRDRALDALKGYLRSLGEEE